MLCMPTVRVWGENMKYIYFAVLLSLATQADARDPQVRAAFLKSHPCPATGKNSGACPGYVVDHVIPLCAGGADAVANMVWQELAASKIKDAHEMALCADIRKERAVK